MPRCRMRSCGLASVTGSGHGWCRTGGDALAVNEIVRAVEQQLGRRAAPFRLDLLTLPVRGLWRREAAVGAEVGDRSGLQPSPALLLSQHLRADRAELERVVRPVIAALA